MQTTHLQKLFSVILLLAAVLIAGNAALAFHAEQILADSERWVIHSLEVITGLERAMRTAFDAESSARGYVLTGDRTYLGGYQYAQNTLIAQLKSIEELTRDNPPQASRMRRATGLAAQKLDRLRAGVTIGHGRHSFNAGEEANRQAGRLLMSQLNDTVQAAEVEERRLLVLRLRGSARARSEAKFTVALASTLDILFVIFSLWSLGYERRLRHRAAETASRLQKLQAVTEVAFTQLTVNELTAEPPARNRPNRCTGYVPLVRNGDRTDRR